MNHPAQADEAKGMTDLKPCPFCGGAPVKREVNFWTGRSNSLIRVEFQHWCAGESPRLKTYIKADGVTEAEAISAWNRRPALHPDGGNPR
jgi:hypothetical protein